MSIPLKTLCQWLDGRLNLAAFGKDCSNNGLQVEACETVRRVVAGVDASMALFEAAARAKADLVLVHHGLSWGSEPRRLNGWVGRRFAMLMRNNMSLYACHLPLDAHPEVGNNARLAEKIDLLDREAFFEYDGRDIGIVGNLALASSAENLAMIYEESLPCEARLFGPMPQAISRVGIVSGGGGMDGLIAAAEAGAQLFITGEMEHVMYHVAQELNVGVLALGHYASETVGVKAVLQELCRQFPLEGEFIDLPTSL